METDSLTSSRAKTPSYSKNMRSRVLVVTAAALLVAAVGVVATIAGRRAPTETLVSENGQLGPSEQPSDVRLSCRVCDSLDDHDCLIALGQDLKSLNATYQQLLKQKYEIVQFETEGEMLTVLIQMCLDAVIGPDMDSARESMWDYYSELTKDAAVTMVPWDIDGSGGITLGEWRAAYTSEMMNPPTEAAMMAYFDTNDSDRDGEISPEEAIKATQPYTNDTVTTRRLDQVAGADDLLPHEVTNVTSFSEECCDGGSWCVFLFCPSFTCWWYDCYDNIAALAAGGDYHCENSGC